MSLANFDPKTTLVLVDLSSFIFRAYHAIRPLTDSKGRMVQVPFGVLNMLLKVSHQLKPEHLCLMCDSPGGSFRKHLFPEYKANRPEAPQDLKDQIYMVMQLLDTFELKRIEKAGFEADDLIASSARLWCQTPENRVLILSGDKDLFQLVNSQVHQWDTLSDKYYEPQQVFEKFGVTPDQMLEFLSLVGDSSDNVPGVAGIGAQGAAKILSEYKTFAAAKSAAEKNQLSKRYAQAILAGEASFYLSKSLITLDDQSLFKDPVTPLLDQMGFVMNVTPQAQAFLEELGFHSILKKLPPPPEQKKNTPSLPYEIVTEEKRLLEITQILQHCENFAFDLETTSLNFQEAKIVGFSVCWDAQHTAYIPLLHTEGHQLNAKWALATVKPILENPKIQKIGQNLKFDFKILSTHNITLQGIAFDTMIASYILNETTPHNLGFLAQQYLGRASIAFESLVGEKKSTQLLFSEVSIEKAAEYAAEDAWLAYQLKGLFEPMLKEQNLWNIFVEIDMPLVPILGQMELNGITVDIEYLAKLEQQFQKELETIQKQIETFNEGPLNLNSPKQLAIFLFEKLKLPHQEKIKSGFSTDHATLLKLQKMHPAIDLLLDYRELSKLQGTYVLPLQRLAHPISHRVHSQFHQTITATGRLSSSDPNLQNIPVKSDRHSLIRKAFIARPGWTLISADYSQIELRILAHLSEDPALLKAFANNQDVHKQTASQLFKIPEFSVTDQQRSIAKTINFGLIYGKTPYGLSQELNISRVLATQLIERYFIQYAGVKTFLDQQIKTTMETGRCYSLYGRRRMVPEAFSAKATVKSNAERIAMNSPIQATAADLIKKAMIKLAQVLEKKSAQLLLQVHDEVVVEAPNSEVPILIPLIKESLESADTFRVPLLVNLQTGQDWQSL
jgi:DNA polymerase-1